MKNYLIAFLLIISNSSFSQATRDTYGIKDLPEDNYDIYDEFQELFENLPYEAQPSITVEDNIIYFILHGKENFDKIFKNDHDGIAVEIVRREQFDCGKVRTPSSQCIKEGIVLKPMYRSDMVQNLWINEEGYVVIEYGNIPHELNPMNLEYNLMILQNFYECLYIQHIHTESSNWDLLAMELYKDSIASEELHEQKLIAANLNPNTFRTIFNQKVVDKNILEIITLQQILFKNIRNQVFPADFIEELEVPEEFQFSKILNNFEVFSYNENNSDISESIKSFEQLLALNPENPEVLYNLIALKIKAWQLNESYINYNDIKNSIQQLKRIGFDEKQIQRLKVNYLKLLGRYLFRIGDYENKNRTLSEVYKIYQKMDLNDKELLSLSKYLSHYDKSTLALKAIYDKAFEDNANEDLLYFYIHLTISNELINRMPFYKQLLSKAIKRNNKRFCDLYLPIPQGGHTFQLLHDQYLNKLYCENCNY